MAASTQHETVKSLVADAQVFRALLHSAFGDTLPAFDTVAPDSESHGAPRPVELTSDLTRVLMLGTKPVLGVIPEVQLSVDSDKRYSWPHYACSFRSRVRAPTVVVVITTDPAVAAWARVPIDLGPGTAPYTVTVIGPEGIPRVESIEEAVACPPLAMLSAMALINAEADATAQAEAAALAVRAAFLTATDARGLMYYDLVRSLLAEATRKVFEMLPLNYQLQDEGLRKAMAEGEAKGKAEAVLAVLAARAIPVTAEQRVQVEHCTDVATLDRWLAAAATCTVADALFTH